MSLALSLDVLTAKLVDSGNAFFDLINLSANPLSSLILTVKSGNCFILGTCLITAKSASIKVASELLSDTCKLYAVSSAFLISTLISFSNADRIFTS